MGFFDKIKNGIQKTKENIMNKIDLAIKSFTKIDEALFEEIEESLILGDVGVETSKKICEILRKKVKETGTSEPSEVKGLLKEIIKDMLGGASELKTETKPSIILVIGVNGVGKTTTIGKLAYNYTEQGKKVILAAADTFRAAAIQQLEIWAEKSGSKIIKREENSDPASVIYDSISAAKARGADLIICDTAGRLHNKKNLMAELQKISKIIERELPDADKEVLLVLDAATGQNAISQACEFKSVTNVTGIALTKLDGTAKGGIILAVKNILDIPVKLIGVGEGIDDLQAFDKGKFVDALFD
jgi:signal recognition particle-docking protein FtsY